MGICGYVLTNQKKDLDSITILEKMAYKLSSCKDNILPFLHKNICMASTYKLTSVEQTSTFEILGYTYTCTFYGRLFNLEIVCKHLQDLGYTLKAKSEAEITTIMYVHYKEKLLEFLDGEFCFSVFDEFDQKLFIARDRLGIKPIYYTCSNDYFVFASKIDSILSFPNVKRILGKEELCELMGLGPAHTPNKTYFKDIFVVPPGHFLTFDLLNHNLSTTCYWDLPIAKLKDTNHNESIKTLLEESCKNLIDNNSICMLSGGLDSTILTCIASKARKSLCTYSLSYANNDNDFKANSYQLTKDSDYTKIASKYFNTLHKEITIDEDDLINNLRACVLAKDSPRYGRH